MARNRTPTVLLAMRGGYQGNHPERVRARAGELPQDEPLGDPPERLDESERARWIELAENAPAGLLLKRDRLVVEQACVLWARMVRGELSITGHRLLASLTAKLGLNPSDASRVGPPPSPRPPSAGGKVSGLARFMARGGK